MVVRGERTYKGVTQRDLDPLKADIQELLSRFVDDGGKQSHEAVNYTQGGPFPFVCETCSYFQRKDETCSIVDGPYDGGVEEQDTCTKWEPGRYMSKRAKKPQEAP